MIAALLGTVVGNPLTLPLIASISLGLGRRDPRLRRHAAATSSRIQDAFGQFFAGLWQSFLSLFGTARASGTSCPLFSAT